MSVLSLGSFRVSNNRHFCSSLRSPTQISRKNIVLVRAAYEPETDIEPSTGVEIPQTPTPAQVTSTTQDELSMPDWMPEQGKEVLKIFSSTDFDVKAQPLYKEKLAKYIETDLFQNCIGWKALPESIHGRLAMIGFLTGVLAEIFGAGSMLNQFGSFPAPVTIFVVLITAGSIIPIVKGTEGDYMDSLRDQYSVPAGVFTESMERLHGRLAMVGLSVIFLVEALSNSALF
eukprot:TRINITY_DN3913_c0_g1_i3.p1 TRINITY_DN3913_c0_g1~~TRINITY_DN3913_c0_g1_i3.p1  ORF type:complete len:247 (-),score=6.13 TRINITY_DN3913_c0_g1_i3:140-829(-)